MIIKWRPTYIDWAANPEAQWMHAGEADRDGVTIWWTSMQPFWSKEVPGYWVIPAKARLGIVRNVDTTGYPPEWWAGACWERPDGDAVKLMAILNEKGYSNCQSCGREIDSFDMAWNNADTNEGTPYCMVICQCSECHANVFKFNSWWPGIDDFGELLDVLQEDLEINEQPNH